MENGGGKSTTSVKLTNLLKGFFEARYFHIPTKKFLKYTSLIINFD